MIAALIVALRHRRITLGVMLATVAATGYLFVVIPKGFFPQQDTGLIVGISEAAADVSPDGMKERQRAILEIAARDPAVASAVGYIGPGGPTVTEDDGRVFITLKPHGERNVTADQVIARLSKAVQQVQGMRLYMQAAQDITIGSRLSKTQYQYTLVDIDQDELNLYASKLMAKLQDLPELTAVASDQEAPGRTQRVQIDRPAAALFGITPATIDSTLYDAFGQRHIARIYAALNEYYVILEVNPQYQLGPNALQRIYVLSQNNTMVPLSQIASLTPAVTPIVINHQGQFPSVTLSFNLAPGATIGAAVSAVQKATADLHLPPSIATSFQGNAQAFQSSLSTTPPLILAALFAVYIILGMLYESTIHPLTILSTLPRAGLGALGHAHAGRPPARCDRHYRHHPLDRHREEERHHAYRRRPRRAAPSRVFPLRMRSIKACLLRFRPILMTTMCALFGGVPLMLGTGTGSEIRQPLGYAIVGGLLVSQLLTLFTTPIVYIYMDKLRQVASRSRTKPAPTSTPRELAE